jgi:hypothetical protein
MLQLVFQHRGLLTQPFISVSTLSILQSPSFKNFSKFMPCIFHSELFLVYLRDGNIWVGQWNGYLWKSQLKIGFSNFPTTCFVLVYCFCLEYANVSVVDIYIYIYIYIYTGRFIIFSVITNIYNKKPKGPTLMELFTATGKLKFFLTTRDVRCVHHEWHGTHRYDIQILATNASTLVHRYFSLLQLSVPLGQRGHVTMMGRMLCTKCTLHSKHRLTRVIFKHKKWLLP